MKARVLFHNHCFDGATSAALVSDLLQALEPSISSFEYQGLTHGPDPFQQGRVFSAELNALVDFRFFASERVHWWFDHHISAFDDASSRLFYEERRADTGQLFCDPAARSCASFMTHIVRERFGIDLARDRTELISWAELIDSASFENPEHAVSLDEPALQIMTAVEKSRDPAFTDMLIRRLRTDPLEVIAASAPVQSWVQRAERHLEEAVKATRKVARLMDGRIVFADLIDTGLYAVNKFIPYLLYPDAAYAVWSFSFPHAIKISVGSNPWLPELREHNIAQICERYGGGGHPFVGAISVPRDQPERARQILNEVLETLYRPSSSEASR